MAELSMPKLSVSISRVSVEELKLVILSADFLLNFVGAEISMLSAPLLADSLVPLLLILPVLCEGMLRNENSSRNFMNACLYPLYPVQSSV